MVTGFKKYIDLSEGFVFKYNCATGFKTDKSTTNSYIRKRVRVKNEKA